MAAIQSCWYVDLKTLCLLEEIRFIASVLSECFKVKVNIFRNMNENNQHLAQVESCNSSLTLSTWSLGRYSICTWERM